MKSIRFAVAGLILLGQAIPASAQEAISDVFNDPKLNLNIPEQRAAAVARIKAIEDQKAENTRAKAKLLGLEMRIKKPNGGVMQIVDFEGDQPVYIETKNVNAAISTGADLLQTAPYTLDGSGLTVGVWDGGSILGSHQEFIDGSRVTNKDGSATSDHATHVGGTIAALGVDPDAKGMAVDAKIDSYDWDNDVSEMASRAASALDQLETKIYLSNHSYGMVNGWYANLWLGNGTDQNAADFSFGQYDIEAAANDSLIYNSKYYISLWAAGNDGNDNPTPGSKVKIGGKEVAYDPAKHPAGDGLYRNGYEMIAGSGIGKNVLTIGAVKDAVTLGVRDPSKGTLAPFSSTGPTDDGRIKPDLVGNGVEVYSPLDTNTTAYDSYSGTSMATPNVTGSATLVIDQYKSLFNSAMRSSTLKGLLIHTATDIGNPGPDYKYGWGLVNANEAADLVIDHHATPAKERIREDEVSTLETSKTYTFLWDDSSPIRATLCWTDPAGKSTGAHDSRTPVLINDLNIKLIAPDGTEYFPFVMPFVGSWQKETMDDNATTGVNHTDNVEQVLIESPGQSGEWQVIVDYTGSLTNITQQYALIMSGVLDPNTVKAPSLDAVSINNDAIYTTAADVTLFHTRKDGYAEEYRASENADLSGEAWLPYDKQPTFTLGGYGIRTVYMQLRNNIGESGVLSDSINYPDPTDPPTLDSFTINSGDLFTAVAGVTLSHTWSKGVPTQYRASENSDFAGASWRAYAGSSAFTLAGFGARTVYFQLRNSNGTSAVLSDSITYQRPATIAVSFQGVPIASGYESPKTSNGTDFGTIIYQDSAVSRTFTVKNHGDKPLSITSLALPSGFFLVEGLPATLGAGESNTFTVRLSNTLVGTNTGQIVITNSDTAQPSFRFSIKGIVIAPEASVKTYVPVAYPTRIRTFEDKNVAFLITGSDPRGRNLVFRILERPKFGKLTGTAPNLVYVPDLNKNGIDYFTFEVSNGIHTSAPAKVDLVVTAVNDPPVAKSMRVLVPRNGSKMFRLRASDIDTPLTSLRYEVIAKPRSGILRWDSYGRATFTPEKGFVGTIRFDFVASDRKSLSKPGHVTLLVE